MHDAMVQGFEGSPWVNVVVELDEQAGLLFYATLDGDLADSRLQLGAPVEVVFKDVTPEVSLPYFKLVSS